MIERMNSNENKCANAMSINDDLCKRIQSKDCNKESEKVSSYMSEMAGTVTKDSEDGGRDEKNR